MALERSTRGQAARFVVALGFMIVFNTACSQSVTTWTEADGGASASAVKPTGHAATEQVSAGERSSSKRYRMVFTVGQSSPHQEMSSSENFRLRGGVVGANGSEQ